MTTEEIAYQLKLTAQLMELHEINPFKVKSIANAAFKLDKTAIALEGLSLQELEKIEGIGKGIASKINELQTTGTLKELSEMLVKTPLGVVDMLGIKGIGPKKVGQLWRELQVESIGELLYACTENRLTSLKGFGSKTQEQVKKQIEFHQSNKGKFHFATVELLTNGWIDVLKKKYKTDLVSFTGTMRRKNEIIEKVEIVIATTEPVDETILENKVGIALSIITCLPADFYSTLFYTSASEAHLKQLGTLPVQQPSSEKEIYDSLKLAYIEPELREGLTEVELARLDKLPSLVEFTDLRGILHNHSTYSDGIHSLKEMAEHCKQLGYEYLGICDHSQSAFYANGLKPERVLEQQQEIDKLNQVLYPFKIFKGIESDILNDGSLDYSPDILKTFDFIVASVHSNLKMTEEKATARIIKAVENPYTTLLGHPTGRLLLSRSGYPIDHKKIIDACAANGVIIELNAHPYRLDIDWRWIPYCLQKGVKISINPDAHEKNAFDDMRYGTYVARKGMLTKEMCFNTWSREEMDIYFKTKKNR